MKGGSSTNCGNPNSKFWDSDRREESGRGRWNHVKSVTARQGN